MQESETETASSRPEALSCESHPLALCGDRMKSIVRKADGLMAVARVAMMRSLTGAGYTVAPRERRPAGIGAT